MTQAIKQAKPGDRVKFNFNGTLEDGTLFDTTYEGSGGCESGDCDCGDDNCNCSDGGCGCGDPAGPMELEIGAENFFPQVEAALIGMAVGDKKTITIKTEDAFGEYDAEQVSAVPRAINSRMISTRRLATASSWSATTVMAWWSWSSRWMTRRSHLTRITLWPAKT